MQEVEHSDVRISIEEEASKHVVLHRQAPWDYVATSPQHAAVISWIGMTTSKRNDYGIHLEAPHGRGSRVCGETRGFCSNCWAGIASPHSPQLHVCSLHGQQF